MGNLSWPYNVAFSPDGTTLASVSGDYAVRLWDVATGTQKGTLTGHTYEVYSVSFSPDGKTLVSGSGDYTVRLWDVATGTQKGILTELGGGSASFSPDGETIASGSWGAVRLWDVATGTQKHTLTGHTGNVRNVSFSPDGKTIATGGWDRTVYLWDVATGTQKGTLTGHIFDVRSVPFSPDGKTIASGSVDGTVRLWDVATGTQKGALQHTSWAYNVSFSPDGKTLASGGWDKTVYLWDVATETQKGTLTGHTNPIHSVSFSPDGKTIASGSFETVHLWDVATGTLKHTLMGHSFDVLSVSFSPDGKTLASGSADSTVRLWDVATGTQKGTLTGHTDWVNSVSFSPDGKTLASGSSNDTVRLWDVGTGTQKGTPTGHTGSFFSVSFSPDGKTIASGSWGEVRLWDVETETQKGALTGHIGAVYSVSFSPDGITLASGSADGTVLLWDLTLYLDITPEPPDTEDIPGPTVAILTPSAGQILDHGRPVITGEFSGDAPIRVTLSINGEDVEVEVIENGFTFAPPDAISDGEYTLVAEVTDDQGNTAETSVTFTVEVPTVDPDPLDPITPTDPVVQDGEDPSLILYLSFDELNGNQAIDHSQYQNHGALVGNPQLVDGRYGKALQFDGQNDSVEVPHHDSLTVDEAFTVMAWIQTPRHTGYKGIIAKSNRPRSYSFYTDPAGKLHLSVGNWTGSHSDEIVALNEWQHVVAQFENGWHRYWINGKNVGNFEVGDTLPGAADLEAVLIGNTHESARNFFGLIDEVRIYNRALSEAEIIQLMQTGYQTMPVTLTYLKEDVNRDGVVDLQDLMLVAADLTKVGEYATDVNEDGTVNIADLVLVAGAQGSNSTASIPALHHAKVYTLSRTDVEMWLQEAKQLNFADPKSVRGIRFLEQLLLTMTPEKTALLANYPNPFNPETWIPYQLAKPAKVTLTIYGANGQIVRQLALGHQLSGIYQNRSRAAYWDGKNEAGESVASGVYFYTLTAGDFSATRKMLILK